MPFLNHNEQKLNKIDDVEFKSITGKSTTNDGSTDIFIGKNSDDTNVFEIDSNGAIKTIGGDNTESGYFDIGNMRIQWGSVASGTSGASTVTLPSSFANAFYSVTANILYDGTEWLFTIAISNKTTTSFIGTKIYGNKDITDIASQGFNWIAIGQKPT